MKGLSLFLQLRSHFLPVTVSELLSFQSVHVVAYFLVYFLMQKTSVNCSYRGCPVRLHSAMLEFMSTG